MAFINLIIPFCIYILHLLPSSYTTFAGEHSSPSINLHHHAINKEQETMSVHERLAIKNILLDKEEKNYIISISVKFSDGSEIWSEKDFEAEHKQYNAHQVYQIEDILKATNGIEVKYIENPKMIKAVAERNMTLFKEAQFEGGYVRFKADVEKALVIKRMEDGTLHKEIKQSVEFRRKKGQEELIWHLFKEIQKFDDRWYLPGEDLHVYKGNQQFDVILDGHTMVALSIPNGKDENGEEKLKEIVRYHFNGNGLNIFLKDGNGNYNYVMKSHPNGFVNAEIAVQRKRGQYVKGEFRPRLWSRKLSISKMNEIALNVVNGRPWGGDFKCHNFVYEFVQSIVAFEDLEHLKQFDSWPEVHCILNDLIIGQDSGRSAFHKSVPYRYNYKQQKHQHHDKN